MGVMECNVTDCEHIMCDRYSEAYGYICNDCFDRLVNDGQVKRHEEIEEFFERCVETNPKAIRKYYDEIFPDKNDEDD